ncbi:DUF302 domain-containing protein [Nonlabens antarcticus]|uniref:DUF302 domain-containing protein n=1 Tax=Nonlabens antarcticus TaxID=392714 RepID=UPI001891ABEE|nr:DUF302 domain-containing protein [Nonlabens antarcticus]
MKKLAIVLILALVSCESQERESDLPDVLGANYALSTQSFIETYESIENSLKAAAPISIVAVVDHKSNAASVNQELKDAKTIFFGNPALGTAFMQENQQAGLDLPQKFAVYTTQNDTTILIYNDVDYLKNRHGVDPATAPKVATALENIALKAKNSQIIQNKESVTRDEGVVVVKSDRDFELTYQSLINALNANPAIKIIAELDHQQNAASVNLSLLPTRVVILGNPTSGTPLLQKGGSISLDLPQKMLVYQDATGIVKIAFNDASFMAKRHNLNNAENIAIINNALATFAETAAGR